MKGAEIVGYLIFVEMRNSQQILVSNYWDEFRAYRGG
jgi:hypothetical protein